MPLSSTSATFIAISFLLLQVFCQFFFFLLLQLREQAAGAGLAHRSRQLRVANVLFAPA
jgi:hypothetical protein